MPRLYGKPSEVKVYDFVDPELGKAAPYGVYDPAKIRAGLASALAAIRRNSL
jgi:hypothetical protein